MITGFNTDIEFNGITYHVQTEDKGVDTPLILSLVYQNGTILAAKRSQYEDILGDNFDKKVLTERLQRQHKLICAAVHKGRIEDLKKMSDRKPERVKAKSIIEESAEILEIGTEGVNNSIPPTASPAMNEVGKVLDKIDLLDEGWTDVPIEAPSESLKVEVVSTSDEAIWDLPIVEDAEILEDDEFVLSANPVEIISEIIEIEGIARDELKISFLKNYDLKSGQQEEIAVEVFRGDGAEPIKGANVMVKVLGADFRPMIFHTKTDQKGIALVLLKLPNFRSGRAAILARAIDGGEEVEIRKVISHK